MLSGIVQLADISDFINPSQSCVKSILDPKTAKISLADCLACNGCITAAETILIEEHSVEKFIQKSKDKFLVLSISNQSLLSLVSYANKSPHDIIADITKAFKPSLIIDINPFVQYALRLSYEEIKERMMLKQKKLICSECPGWICYSEKKVDENILPYLSKIKSPQQIMGIIVRKIMTSVCNIANEDLCIATIMPCFDKKIESVRNANEVDCVLSTIEVEDYITKGNLNKKEEIEEDTIDYCCYYTLDSLVEVINQWIKEGEGQENSVLFTDYILKQNKKNRVKDKPTFDYAFMFPHNYYSSNGYVDYIIQQLQLEYPKSSIELKPGRNIDIFELKIINDDTKDTIASFCFAYGFRNIQNIIKNFKKITYDYIEIMACPGGCLNGGGQMRQIGKMPKFLMNEIKTTKDKPIDQSLTSIRLNNISIEEAFKQFNLSFESKHFIQQYSSIKVSSSFSALQW